MRLPAAWAARLQIEPSMKLTTSPRITPRQVNTHDTLEPKKLDSLDARAAQLPTSRALPPNVDGFEPGRRSAPPIAPPGAAPSSPTPASSTQLSLEAAMARQLAAAGLPTRPSSTPATPGAMPPGAPPSSPLDVGDDPTSPPPEPGRGDLGPGFTTGPDLASFKSAQEARGGRMSHETKTTSSDTQSSNGGQKVKEESTHVGDDGTVTTDKQTHESDGKGNVREEQEVIRRNPDGSEEGHRSVTTVTPDGKVSTSSSEWKKPAPSSTPSPLADDVTPPSDVDLNATLSRKREQLTNPTSPDPRAPVDVERLARGVAVSKAAKVNPRPDAEPQPTGGGRPPPKPADPVEPDVGPRAPSPRPVGGKPGGPRGPLGPVG
jgi:hypothetical protein